MRRWLLPDAAPGRAWYFSHEAVTVQARPYDLTVGRAKSVTSNLPILSVLGIGVVLKIDHE